jgi:uncharacterized protein (TIGR00730 family)
MTINPINSVCVFCGARDGGDPKFIREAQKFAKKLAEKQIQLVYGGGDCGIMGAVANATLEAGGTVFGVFPKFLNQYESEHKGLTRMIIVEDMHTRKSTMFENSDAIVVLPGGFGTLDEAFEVITWKQLNRHNKPIIIFNQDGYWDGFIKLAENIIGNKFAAENVREMYKVVNTIDEIFVALGK